MTNEGNLEADSFTSEVCWHYYVNEMTQGEIAMMLGATRLRVNQAIQRARAMGMVRIEIESPFLPRLDLQDRMRDKFGLRQGRNRPDEPPALRLPRPDRRRPGQPDWATGALG